MAEVAAADVIICNHIEADTRNEMPREDNITATCTKTGIAANASEANKGRQHEGGDNAFEDGFTADKNARSL
jgi:hypothetical protein